MKKTLSAFITFAFALTATAVIVVTTGDDGVVFKPAGVTTFPALTVSGALTTTGAQVPTGGIGPAGGFVIRPTAFHTGGVPAITSASGTDATPSVTETYVCEVFVPANCTLTGVSILNGSATGSGNVTVFLANSSGVTVANSASTAISGTDAYQRLDFAVAYGAVGPATYYVATQYNNTASRFNTHVFGDFRAGKLTSTVYGTLASFTPPATFTTGLGPIASLY